jgi:hypothetical protein
MPMKKCILEPSKPLSWYAALFLGVIKIKNIVTVLRNVVIQLIRAIKSHNAVVYLFSQNKRLRNSVIRIYISKSFPFHITMQ